MQRTSLAVWHHTLWQAGCYVVLNHHQVLEQLGDVHDVSHCPAFSLCSFFSESQNNRIRKNR